MMDIKGIISAVLCAGTLLLLASCGSAVPDTESAAHNSSAHSELEFYDSFSAAELENMRYSKLAVFSLTCDYDTREIKFYSSGDEIKITYKLTNMTGLTLDTELAVLGGERLEDMAYIYSGEKTNPVATGYSEEKTFQPYETYEIPVTLTVPEGGGNCYIGTGIGIQVFNPEVYERMQINYCGISLEDMYVPVRS